MREFVIIAGKINSGKTTTAWIVYQRLLPYATNYVFYKGGAPVDNYGDIVYKNAPHQKEPCDFKAELIIHKQKIVIISAGDDRNYLKQEINSAIAANADIIVTCLRSYNKTGSSRRMINTYFSNIYRKEYRISERDEKITVPQAIVNAKRLLADKIVNYILVISNHTEFL